MNNTGKKHRDNWKITKRLAALAIAAMLTFTGCAGTQSTSAESSDAGITAASVTYDAASKSEMFTDRDLSGEYDEAAAVKISLNGNSAEITAEGTETKSADVSIDGTTLTITGEGTYILSGSLTDGMIIVDADDSAKVQIVLDGASVTSASSAALYVKSADKVFVTTAAGTENTLANGGTFTAIDDSNIDGAVFAKDDITFNGGGTLTVTSPAGHGIVGKDDVKIAGGTLKITAAKHGIQANDSARLAAADITVTAGTDGVHVSDDSDAEEGTESDSYFYIADASLTVDAGDDGIHADAQALIEGGRITVNSSYEGIEALDIEISGGTTIVEGPSSGDTSVIDYNTTATISGGTFIGTGGAGMAASFSSAENQGLIAVSTGNQSAGTTVTLTDSNGKVIAEQTPELDYAVVYISTEDVQQGSTYTLTAGSYSETIELTDAIYSNISGGMNGGMGGRGDFGGGEPQQGRMNDGGEPPQQDGTNNGDGTWTQDI